MHAGRPLKLPKRIHEHDFALLAKTEKHSRTRIHLLGLYNLQIVRETAKILEVHEMSVKNWQKKISKEGLDGIKEQKGEYYSYAFASSFS